MRVPDAALQTRHRPSGIAVKTMKDAFTVCHPEQLPSDQRGCRVETLMAPSELGRLGVQTIEMASIGGKYHVLPGNRSMMDVRRRLPLPSHVTSLAMNASYLAAPRTEVGIASSDDRRSDSGAVSLTFPNDQDRES